MNILLTNKMSPRVSVGSASANVASKRILGPRRSTQHQNFRLFEQISNPIGSKNRFDLWKMSTFSAISWSKTPITVDCWRV